jgi:hypothetical protein
MDSKVPLIIGWDKDPKLDSRDQIRKALAIIFDDADIPPFDEGDFTIQDESISQEAIHNKGRKPNAK